MKKICIMVLFVVLVAVPVWAVSVVSSKHDMIATGFFTASGGAPTEVCIFCHTPHGAQTSVTQAPLWNNDGTIATSTITGFYSSATMNTTYTVSQATAIDRTDARLCLSCHDGSVGQPVNGPNVNGGSLDNNSLALSANSVIGLDLSNDHPIGMDLKLDPEVQDIYLRPIVTIEANFGGVDPFFGSNPDDNTMWCSSCHDVHNNGFKPFLRINNSGSALCKACHVK